MWCAFGDDMVCAVCLDDWRGRALTDSLRPNDPVEVEVMT